MSRLSTWAIGLLLFGGAVFVPSQQAVAQAYLIVVNEAGPSSLSRDEVSRAFLKKSSRLSAVDQPKDSRVRAAFTKAILGRPVNAVASYWQQQIFSGGDSPPVEKTTDADVVAFVRANPKAIGYVAASTDLGAGVKAVTVQ